MRFARGTLLWVYYSVGILSSKALTIPCIFFLFYIFFFLFLLTLDRFVYVLIAAVC